MLSICVYKLNRKRERERGLLGKEKTMRELEGAVKWLRPLVDSKAWDYCVVWKLGDDPSRFIEWMGCCCTGAVGDCGECHRGMVKEEKGEGKHLATFCRDGYLQHPVRTKACEALAQLPTFMPLYSGIHGEVVISSQSQWLIIHAKALDSNAFLGSVGTRVLIPVSGGIIELFAAKHVEEDRNIIELIQSQCAFGRQEDMIPLGYSNVNLKNPERSLDLLFEENLQSLPLCCHLVPRIRVLPPLTNPDAYKGFEGSSSSSNPSNEHSLFDLYPGHMSQNEHFKQLLCKSSVSRNTKHNNTSLKEQGGKYKSKNLITERNRRTRIRDGLHALRALVPKISKMDKASILGDAIDYIGELEEEANKLKDELREIEEQECREINPEIESKTSKAKALRRRGNHLTLTKYNQDFCGFRENRKSEVQLEVNQIGKRHFLIKLFCESKRGGFGKLMEALSSIGIQVLDANITTFNRKVLNILKVEAREGCSTEEIERVIYRAEKA